MYVCMYVCTAAVHYVQGRARRDGRGAVAGQIEAKVQYCAKNTRKIRPDDREWGRGEQVFYLQYQTFNP